MQGEGNVTKGAEGLGEFWEGESQVRVHVLFGEEWKEGTSLNKHRSESVSRQWDAWETIDDGYNADHQQQFEHAKVQETRGIRTFKQSLPGTIVSVHCSRPESKTEGRRAQQGVEVSDERGFRLWDG